MHGVLYTFKHERTCLITALSSMGTEINSVANLKRNALKLPLTILGDGLFADQSVVEAIRKHGFNFILTSKPDDNKFLHEEFWLITTKKYHFEYQDEKYLHCYS